MGSCFHVVLGPTVRVGTDTLVMKWSLASLPWDNCAYPWQSAVFHPPWCEILGLVLCHFGSWWNNDKREDEWKNTSFNCPENISPLSTGKQRGVLAEWSGEKLLVFPGLEQARFVLFTGPLFWAGFYLFIFSPRVSHLRTNNRPSLSADP